MPTIADDSDSPRSLRSPDAVAHRRQLLHQPHIAPLAAYVETLRAAHPALEFPDFDPLDGGSDADLLFLLEKPGPMTSARAKGSGFVSRNNNDPTAEATFNFMKQAGLARRRTVIWNVIPGWNGTLRIAPAELLAGMQALKGLLALLPRLRTVILVGQKAQRAAPLIEPLGLRILHSAHPSPQVRAARPELWYRIPGIWSQANQTVPSVKIP